MCVISTMELNEVATELLLWNENSAACSDYLNECARFGANFKLFHWIDKRNFALAPASATSHPKLQGVVKVLQGRKSGRI